MLALRPDLVVAHPVDLAAAARLQAAGCPVFDPGEVTNLAEHEAACLQLSNLLNVRRQAETLVNIAQRRARILQLHAPHPRVLAAQTLVSEQEPERFARLRSALDLAGLSLADKGEAAAVIIQLPPNALRDPHGDDLLEIATAPRTQLAAGAPTP